MAPSPPHGSTDVTRFSTLIEKLVDAEVEFIVVGGIAGILAGSSQTTDDLDIVFRVTDENVERLMSVLEEIDATYVDLANRVFRPTPEKLWENRLNLFETNLGRFDVLPKLSDRWTYEDLLPRSVTYASENAEFHALGLDGLIEVKRAAGRPKDLQALPVLERLRELEEGSGS